MTKRDRKVLGKYVRWMADHLGLRDWTLHISHEPAADDCYASIRCVDGRKVATLRFDQNFRDLEPDVQRHTVVHELIHCHLEGMWLMVDNDLQPHIGRPAFDFFSKSFERHLEFATDGLADAFAPRVPVIDWSRI